MYAVGLSIFCAVIVAATIRIVPILFFANRTFPETLRLWLTFVPPAIFTAIVANETLNSTQTSIGNLSVGLLTTISAFLVGLIFKNLFSAVIASIVFFLIFQYYEVILHYFHILV